MSIMFFNVLNLQSLDEEITVAAAAVVVVVAERPNRLSQQT
jgi:hypothetical protein